MAYNTGNPIGSTSPKDLSDNARNLDLLLLGDAPSYLDRKGAPRKSWKGMEREHVAAQTSRESQFAAAQVRRTIEFNEFLARSGYETPVVYAPGLNITRPTQTVRYMGEIYRPKASAVPFLTSTFPADEAKWIAIGDASLRQELSVDAGRLVSVATGLEGSISQALEEKFIGVARTLEEFGGRGDGIVDNKEAFFKWRAAGGHLRLLPNRVYRTTEEVHVKGGVLDFNGSRIILDLKVSTQRGIRVMDNGSVYNGKVDLITAITGDAFGDALIPIIVGQYYEGVGYKNTAIKRMEVTTTRLGGVGIFVTGDSSENVVDSVRFPATDKGTGGIYAEWGGRVGVATYHPHNLRWSNITVEARTSVIASPDGLLLGTSGCYNVLIENFVVEAGPGCNLHPIGIKVGGGAGFAFAVDERLRNMQSPNVSFRNGRVINNGTRPCIWLLGRSSTGARSWPSGGVLFKDIEVIGNASVNGTLTEYTRGGRFENVTISKCLQGHAYGPGVSETEYVGGDIFENMGHGMNIGNTASPPRNIKVRGVRPYRNGQSSLTNMNTYFSGVFLNNSEGVEVSGVLAGSGDGGIETQYSSINAGGASPGRVKGAKVFDNHTLALRNLRPEDTPVAYVYGADATDFGAALPSGRFQNNTCAETVTQQKYFGMRPLITHSENAPIGSSTSTTVKRAVGPSQPTAGQWARGDTIVFTPGAVTNPGGFTGCICTTPGEGGVTAVFKNTGAIAT